MKGECLNQCNPCPIKKKHRGTVGHHLYYYRRDYETPIEKAFREKHIIDRCVCVEINDPHLNPPKKPDLLDMIIDLTVKLEGII